MDYKVLLIKNSYTKKVNLTKYLVDWFKKNTPLNIIVDEISTNFDVTPQIVSNATFQGIICSPEIIPKLRTVVPENKYNAVILYADNLSGGIRVSVCNGEYGTGFLYPNTELIQITKVNDSGKTANHELFHAFFYKLKRLGIQIEDNMDTYLNNSEFTVDSIIDTNREVALLKLAPYWKQICDFSSHKESSINNPLSSKPEVIVKPLSTWKYFKLTEKTGKLGHTVADLDPKLVDKLDTLRGICGFPFVITSGYRTSSENDLVGGKSGSAHTKRLAVDIACTDTKKRMSIIGNAWNMGFIGIGIDDSFVHLDIVEGNKRIWLY